MLEVSITTWNINSVRVRLDLIARYLEHIMPDIICLQETKVIDAKFPSDFFTQYGYKYMHIRGEMSYNGVAILSKLPISILPNLPFIDDARFIGIGFCNNVELHNLYIPAGGDIPDVDLNDKFKYKLQFLDEYTKWLINSKKSDSKLIILGDFNVAPLENDVWSHKQLIKEVSHTPIEVEKLNILKHSLNFVDSVRKFVPYHQKLYSWWSYRSPNWAKSDRGRRLDHIWVTPSIADDIISCNIYKEYRGLEKPSDHVPINLKITL